MTDCLPKNGRTCYSLLFAANPTSLTTSATSAGNFTAVRIRRRLHQKSQTLLGQCFSHLSIFNRNCIPLLSNDTRCVHPLDCEVLHHQRSGFVQRKKVTHEHAKRPRLTIIATAFPVSNHHPRQLSMASSTTTRETNIHTHT